MEVATKLGKLEHMDECERMSVYGWMCVDGSMSGWLCG